MEGQHAVLKRHIAMRKDRLFSIMDLQILTDNVGVIIPEVMSSLLSQSMVVFVSRQWRIVHATINLVHQD